jgi:hypothetical protein
VSLNLGVEGERRSQAEVNLSVSVEERLIQSQLRINLNLSVDGIHLLFKPFGEKMNSVRGELERERGGAVEPGGGELERERR